MIEYGPVTPFARPAAPALLVLTLLTLAACTDDDDGPEAGAGPSSTAPVLQPGSPGDPNTTVTGTPDLPENDPSEADVDFMQHMIVHHAQAVEMVDLVEDELTDPQVTAIAERIRDSQKPEIGAMANWLERNDEQIPAEAAVATAEPSDGPGGSDSSHTSDTDHTDHTGQSETNHSSMPGMASPEQLQELGQAQGVQADMQFLTLMIAHHKGALDMAVEQRTNGRDILAGEMADDVYAVQASEIVDMETMLERLHG